VVTSHARATRSVLTDYFSHRPRADGAGRGDPGSLASPVFPAEPEAFSSASICSSREAARARAVLRATLATDVSLDGPAFSFNAAVVPDLPASRLSMRGLSLRYDLAVAGYRRRWWCIHELSTLLVGSASPLVCRFYFWSKEESAASDFNAVHW